MKKELINRIFSSIMLIPLTFFIIKGTILFNTFIFVCFLIVSFEWHMMTRKKKYNLIGYIFFYYFILLYLPTKK